MVMDAQTDRLFSKIMNFLMKGMIRKAIIRDMQAVKAFCETSRPM